MQLVIAKLAMDPRIKDLAAQFILNVWVLRKEMQDACHYVGCSVHRGEKYLAM